MKGNKRSGSLPLGFGAAFPKIKSLNLAGNEISGQSSDFSQMNSIADWYEMVQLTAKKLGLWREMLERLKRTGYCMTRKI
ncbi:hypothetical protein K2173_012116 [Erythroxylum novogranatense]|uniref:Uncharacterized protein n=1 Tax=Erythroxylum novogranatense TaxID=1862640 RepID=A0AAV8SR29_9ROSI|nr:hypothetical protein K2173_012116 [Erythroxylum novogranatense]